MSAKILIVDDEADIRRMLAEIFTHEGYQTTTAASGDGALVELGRSVFDLMITDLRMPGMEGGQLVRKARKLAEDMEVIVLTGYATIETAIMTLRDSGAFDYLIKPLDELEKLLITVEQALAKRRLRLENRTINLALARANEKLSASEKRYRALIEKMPIGFVLLEASAGGQEAEPDYRVLEVNPTFSALMAISTEQAVGRRLITVLPDLSLQWIEPLGQLGHPGDAIAFECFAETRGEYYDTLVYRPNRQQAAVIFSRITGRKKMQADLLQAKKMESVGILAGGIAHDFNNLLAIVLGNLSMLDLTTPMGRDDSRAVADAKTASRCAADLVNQLITFSDGGQPAKKNQFVRQLLQELVAGTLSGAPVEAKFDLPDDLWAVEIDAEQISLVFANLVRNAVDALPGGGKLAIRAENFSYAPDDQSAELPVEAGDYLKIVFEDSGPGIKAEHLPLIFDPYFSTKEKGPKKGLGLGLAVAYSILKRHGGHIRVVSQPGQGAAFAVYLPTRN